MTNRNVWIISLVVGLASGGELYYWVTQEDPSVPYRLPVFFFLLFLMCASLGTTAAHYLAIRFGDDADSIRSIRQGLGFGFFVSLCAWLQMVRLLSMIVVVVIASALIAAELIWEGWRSSGREHTKHPSEDQSGVVPGSA